MDPTFFSNLLILLMFAAAGLKTSITSTGASDGGHTGGIVVTITRFAFLCKGVASGRTLCHSGLSAEGPLTEGGVRSDFQVCVAGPARHW